MFNIIAVTLPSTGHTPEQHFLKQQMERDSQELKVGGEGVLICCWFFVTVASVSTVKVVVVKYN